MGAEQKQEASGSATPAKSELPSDSIVNQSLLENAVPAATPKEVALPITPAPSSAANFKYHRTDVKKPTVEKIHYDLVYRIYPDRADIVSTGSYTVGAKPIKELVLDARNLEINDINSDREFTSHYDKAKDKLTITFAEEIPSGTRFSISTSSTCRPDGKTLEGLYFDETPKGAPPQLITQCQQWGFSRMVPSIDEMNAKATFVSKIIADSRYTHLITNGDVIKDETRGDLREVTYANTRDAMPPYITFVGCGTWKESSRELEYPDGKKVRVEVLSLNADAPSRERAVDMLHDSIMWIHVFTGPGRCEYVKQREELWAAIQARELAKTEGDEVRVSESRERIKELSLGLAMGHQYQGACYREIGMRNSYYGGMENKGNTTILDNMLTPHPDMMDGSYMYMVTVKIHEDYHDLNGSNVTGMSPSDIWLNEAVTVHIDQQGTAFFFGESFARLSRVRQLLAPGEGAMANDVAGVALPIEVDHFNDTKDLITAVTYQKGPELVRILQEYIGEDTFVKGLHLYHTRFNGGNATSADWVAAMEEASGLNLKHFASVWLRESGYPKVNVTTSYNYGAGTFTVNLQQVGQQLGRHWEFPFKVALHNAEGRVLAQQTLKVTDPSQSFVINGINQEPAFVSLNREHTLYGKVFYPQATETQLKLQATKDTDMVGRYLAFRELADREKTRLMLDPEAEVDPGFVHLYFEILDNKQVTDEVGTLILDLDSNFLDPKYEHRYQERFDAGRKIAHAVANKYGSQIEEIYRQYADSAPYDRSKSPIQNEGVNIRRRQVKNTCLGLLSRLGTPEVQELVKQQYRSSTNATDRAAAVSCYLGMEGPTREEKLRLALDYVAKARSPVAWENAMRTLAANNSEDPAEIVYLVSSLPEFDRTKVNHLHIYRFFASNRRVSLLTEPGRAQMTQMIKEIAVINPMAATTYVKTIGNIDVYSYKPEHQLALVGLVVDVLQKLKAMQAALEPETIEFKNIQGVYNTLKTVLATSKESVALYQTRWPGGVPAEFV